MKTNKIPSKFQEEIYKEYNNSNCNLIIEAGPGSGKSHTILSMIGMTPKFKKCILVAFNKSIQEELSTKVPANVEVKTIHGLAYSILRKNIFKNFKVTGYKNFILGKKHLNLTKLKVKEVDVYLFLISKIIDLSRMNLCKTREDIEAVCLDYNISTINGEIDDVMKMIVILDKYNRTDQKEVMIDFTDMLYLAYTMVEPELYPKYSVVFCDELQDLNPLQKEIVERIIKHKTGRFVGVGDKRQSIYSFMGANIQAFESFLNRPNTKMLPLSVTYRCSKEVTKEANKIFPGLESFESNEEGEVREGSLEEVKDGDFVICRNNMPLIEAWINIIKQGKKCHILGKEFGKSLMMIIGKLDKCDDYKDGVTSILKKKEDELKSKGFKRPTANNNYQSLVEKLTIINILKTEFGSFEVMKNKIEEIFTDDDKSKGVILMSGHKSKGLETDTVFFLKRDLIPSKYSETPQELYQERCLLYVITTRAKLNLIYIN